jgi:hypothetical protein
MLFLFVYVLTLVLLGFFWYMGDALFRTKVIVTLLYLASWAILLWNQYAVVVVQILLTIILGWLTFGVEFLGRRR